VKVDWKGILKRLGRAVGKALLTKVEQDVKDRLDRTGGRVVKEVKR
jgi:hypothetical protein